MPLGEFGGEVGGEVIGRLLSDLFARLLRRPSGTPAPVTAAEANATANVTKIEVQEVMFAIYGAPDRPRTATGRFAGGQGIKPGALGIFEQIHTEIGPVRGDKVERALALALQQLKNGLWPASVQTIVQRPPQPQRQRGQQPPDPAAQTTTTTSTTTHVAGWEPHKVFVKAFNTGFATLERGKKFVEVLTQESIWDQGGRMISNAHLIEKSKKIARRLFWTWLALLLLTGAGTWFATNELLAPGTTPGVGVFIMFALCFSSFFGLIALPFYAASSAAKGVTP